MEATILTKKYRLVYSGSTIISLTVSDASDVTGTTSPSFETDELDEMKTKIATLGLVLDEEIHKEFI